MLFFIVGTFYRFMRKRSRRIILFDTIFSLTLLKKSIVFFNERHKLKIVERPKKTRSTRAYYYWLAEAQPRRKKRLAQLSKSNHIRRMHTPRSELVVAAEKFEEDLATRRERRGSR
jgi:hypothetical protein